MAWTEDDSEEEPGTSAVAKAFLGDEEAGVPDRVPDPVGGGSTPYSPDSRPETSDYDDMPSGAARAEQQPPSNADDDSELIDQYAGAGASDSTPSEPSGAAGLKAPMLPNTPKYEDELSAHQKLEHDMVAVDPSKYKPSGGRRVLAGLAAGLAAAGHNPNATQIGESIRNQPLSRAQAQNAPVVAADRQALSDLHDRNTQTRQNFNDEVSQYGLQERDMRNKGYVAGQEAQAAARTQNAATRAAAVIPTTMRPKDPANPLGEWVGKNGKGQDVGGLPAPDNYLKTPQGKAALVEDNIKKWGLTGEDAKYYRVNGKLKEPGATNNFRMPSAESDEYNDWKKSLGHTPTADEIRGYRSKNGGAGGGTHGTPAQFSALDKDTDSAYRRAEQDFSEGKIDIAELNLQKAEIGQTHSQRMRDLGGIPAEDGGAPAAKPAFSPTAQPAQSAPSAPAAAPPAQQTVQKAQGLKVGDPIIVDGKPARFGGINPKTGKVIVQ